MEVVVAYTARNAMECTVNSGELIEVVNTIPDKNGFVFARSLTRGPNGEIHSGMVPANCLVHCEAFPPSSPGLESPKSKGLRNAKEKMKMKRMPSFSNMERPGAEVPIFTGWLTKQGDSIKTWKKRWFVLTKDFCLGYFKSPEDTEPIGKILLPSYSIKPSPETNKPYVFKASHSGMRTYFFMAESEFMMNRWISVLTLAANGELPDVESARSSARISDSPAEEVCKAVVTMNYIPNAYDREALQLTVGEVISVLEKTEGGWWKGRNSQQKAGTFPHTYVEEIIDSNRNSGSAPSTTDSENSKEDNAPSSQDGEVQPKQVPKAATPARSPILPPPLTSVASNGTLPPKKPPRGDTLPKGKVGSGRRSIQDTFPNLAVDKTDKATSSAPEAFQVGSSAPEQSAAPQEEKQEGVALFDYSGGTDAELSFSKDEVLTISQTEGSDLGLGWWLGENATGKVGYIPSGYVRLL